MKKRTVSVFTALLLVAVMALGLLAGCAQAPDDGSLKIGVVQYMSHPSLDNCFAGIQAALESSGFAYQLDRQVGSANAADSDCVSYAKNMVAGGYDIIIAIATPAAQAAKAAVEGTDIPVIFCAVSDPVGAGLVMSLEDPGANCSGTSDVLDLESQLEMIMTFQPEARKIGVLYTTSEENSLHNLHNFEDLCRRWGVELVPFAVQGPSDIPAAAEFLASKVDCINNFTDNNVVQNLPTVINAAQKYNIPVYGSEEEQLKSGCLAAASIDYVALGKATGDMAIEALKSGTASMLAVETFRETTTVYNPTVLENLGMTLPEELSDAQVVE